MELRDLVVVALVAVIFGALGGFLAGLFWGVESLEAKIASEGINVSAVRWVDEAGNPRLTVEVPPQAVSQVTPYLSEGNAVISIMSPSGTVEASAVISAGAVQRASGF